MLTTLAPAARGPRLFYFGLTATLIFIIALGFGPGYLGRAGEAEPLPAFVHIHAAVFSFWMLLVLAQTGLIAADRVAVHRKLGLIGALLVPFVFALGWQTMVFGAQRGHPFWKTPDQFVPPSLPFADSLEFMIVPFGDLVVFTLFVAAGLWLRRKAELHKRLMLLAAAGGMLWPAISRLPFVTGSRGPTGLVVLMPLLLAMVLYDRRMLGRVHPATLWGGVLIVASIPLRALLAGTPLWRAFATWATG